MPNTYIFRKWIEEPGVGELPAQSAVAIIVSRRAMLPDQLFVKLSDLVHDPKSYTLIEAPIECSFVLDTWQEPIDAFIEVKGFDDQDPYNDVVELVDWWTEETIKRKPMPQECASA